VGLFAASAGVFELGFLWLFSIKNLKKIGKILEEFFFLL
jgi:hypothetical protein